MSLLVKPPLLEWDGVELSRWQAGLVRDGHGRRVGVAITLYAVDFSLCWRTPPWRTWRFKYIPLRLKKD